jgi:hypothetical protein
MTADPQVPSSDGPGAEFDQAVERNSESFLAKAKQAIVTAIEDAIRTHGGGLLAEARQTLKAALDGLVKSQVEKMVEQLSPVSDATRGLTEGWLRELREFINVTVRDVIEKRIPEYSHRAGQRAFDYALAGSLYALAAVLLVVGGILGLREAGVPVYVTCLIGGAVAMASGVLLLKLRSRRWDEPPTTGRGIS